MDAAGGVHQNWASRSMNKGMPRFPSPLTVVISGALLLAAASVAGAQDVGPGPALPSDLPVAWSSASVPGLRVAPELAPLPVPVGTPRFGLPGPDSLRVAASSGGDLQGGDGSDRLYGETGADTLIGGNGDDVLDGGSGDDRALGEAGADRVFGGFGHDQLDGGSGNDVLDGGAGPDRLVAGDGDDLVHGDSGADVIDGGAGNDVVYADSGPDHITAGDGDDVVYVNNGTAVASVDCGPGEDTVVINPYGDPGGISNAQAVRRDQITGCEQVVEAEAVLDPSKGTTWLANVGGGKRTGTDRNDNLLGSHGSDRISGNGGDD